jgi:hypothetical protein
MEELHLSMFISLRQRALDCLPRSGTRTADATARATGFNRECLSSSRRGLLCSGFKTPTMVGPVPEDAESRKDHSSR